MQVGVIEVGIGGRLDATNVWQGGVTAITNVALDHMEVLGPDDRGDRDGEGADHQARRLDGSDGRGRARAGVIRAPCGARRRAARRRCAARRSFASDRRGTSVAAPGGGELTSACSGSHQAANAAVAWSILDALSDAGIATVS